MSLHCVRRALAPSLVVVLAVLFAFVATPAAPAAVRELRPASAASPAVSLVDQALSLLGGAWTQAMAIVTGNLDNGAGIDPNGGLVAGDNGAGIDPNGGLAPGDNGAGIDPNG
jgi:hypothetical protein